MGKFIGNDLGVYLGLVGELYTLVGQLCGFLPECRCCGCAVVVDWAS